MTKGRGINHDWPDTCVETLRAGALAGHTASRIAADIGRGITRNAVIGKAARLGVPLGRKKNPQPIRKTAVALPVTKPARKVVKLPIDGGRKAGLPTETLPADRALPVIVFDPKNAFFAPSGVALVPVMDLRDSSCRWPFHCDDGVTRYCGREAKDGSWCVEHARRVFAGDARPTMKACAPMQREARAS